MTKENDRRNFSAWKFEKIQTLTVEAICSIHESFFLLSIFVFVTFYYYILE
jgi:hypothetical protein